MKIIKWLFTSDASVDFPLLNFSGPPILILLIIGLMIVSTILIVKDAKTRNRNGLIAALLVLSCWPISILWWYWLRPKSKINKAPNKKDSGNGVPPSQI